MYTQVCHLQRQEVCDLQREDHRYILKEVWGCLYVCCGCGCTYSNMYVWYKISKSQFEFVP